MRILIDARKAFDSGIGTYIRHVIPRVIALQPGVRFAALIETGGQARHGYFAPGSVDFVEVSSLPLGVREQFGLRGVVGGADLFWATSMSHPLFMRTPMVATVHDVAQLTMDTRRPADHLVKAAARIYFRSLRTAASLILFNSEFTRAEFHRYIGESRAAQQVTPLGVDPTWFTARRPDGAPAPQPPHFICIGNLRPHKNLTVLLEAFSAIKDRVPHDLLLVSKDDGFEAPNPTVAALLGQLGKRVRVTGFLGDEALQRLVAGATALVVPSLYEGFGLPALEAMAAGVPVIAASTAALPEVCGDCADYFDPHSADSLRQRLLEVVAWPAATRQARIAEASERARSFTWDKTARLTADALHRLTHGRRGDADRPSFPTP